MYQSGTFVGIADNSREIWLMGVQREAARRWLAGPDGESFNWTVWASDGLRSAMLGWTVDANVWRVGNF